jgi:hypothetical protein
MAKTPAATETPATIPAVTTIARLGVEAVAGGLTAGLTARDECGQARIALLLGPALLLRVRRLRLVLLMGRAELRLRLVLLGRRVVRLRRARRAGVWQLPDIGPGVLVLVVDKIVARTDVRPRIVLMLVLLLLLLVMRILLRELRLRRGDQPEVVLGVLEVALSRYWIARRLRIPRQLHILLGYVVGGSPDLHVGTVRLVDTRQRVMVAAIAAAHSLLTVPHGDSSLLHLHHGVRRLPHARVSLPNTRHVRPAIRRITLKAPHAACAAVRIACGV